MISLATSDIPVKAYMNLLECLRSKRVGRGKFVDLFEEKMAEYFGVKHCLAIANGTVADQLMLMTLKEMNPGKDEVIVPALTFVAQTNAVILAGLKPVFVDVGKNFQMSTLLAEQAVTEKTLCFFPAHLLGKFCYMPRAIGIPAVEDCCEAMGGEYEGKKFGTFGIAGAFSMYPSHTITTGEGGLIISDNDRFMEICRSIHNHGKIDQDFDFQYVGMNAKMTNLQAALGCSLVGNIDRVNEKRQKNVALYNKLLDMEFVTEAPHCYPIILNNSINRDDALLLLKRNGIEARKLMSCVPETPAYERLFGGFNHYPNAHHFANCGLFVPIHQNLTEKDIEKVCEVIRQFRR